MKTTSASDFSTPTGILLAIDSLIDVPDGAMPEAQKIAARTGREITLALYINAYHLARIADAIEHTHDEPEPGMYDTGLPLSPA